jgi:hypothetical protein
VREQFDWLTPSPLWQPQARDYRQADFYRPAILEFQTDDFMNDFFAAAESKEPGTFATKVAVPPLDGQDLKLYQPVHGRFYLVCGSLCCRAPGFPSREVRRADKESAFFVLRRVISGAEYAWLGGGSRPGWKAVGADPRRVLDGEERQPLTTTTAANGRDIFFGYLPLVSLDTYAVPADELTQNGKSPDARVEELRGRFTDPLSSAPKVLQGIADANRQLMISVYLLLDLWEYLNQYLPDVAAALRDDPSATFTGDQAQAEAELMTFLKGQALHGSLTLAAALGQVATNRDALNKPGGAENPDNQSLTDLGFGQDYNLQGVSIQTDDLLTKVAAALPPEKPPVTLPKFDSAADTRYVLRCVYERPQCQPPVRVVGLPSRPFAVARFFDPDAPARPVRIPLPTDISIAGLRKFKKSVGFLISKSLHNKMDGISSSAKSLLKDDPPSFSEGGGDIAYICSFSIQIIFIVAFMLLLIFVIVLNFVFFWLAFFKICLPVPKRLLPE